MKKRILIVDDEIDLVDELSEILQDEGYDVDFAYNGKEAIEKFGENNFNLVLMDVKMPKINGVEAFKKIKKINSQIPVIIMTGSFAKESATIALSEGASDAIFKPFNVDKLLEVIKKYI